MEDWEGYRHYLIRKNLRPSTIEVSLRTIKFVKKNVKDLTDSLITSFCFNLLDSGRNPPYINHIISVVRTYGQYKQLPDLQKIKFFKGKSSHVKATMNDEEIETFLALKPLNHLVDWKKMTMFWKICTFTGMRTGEVAGLTIDCVDFGRGVFILELTKTYTPRVVPIPPNIKEELQEYITGIRGELLFRCARSGGPLAGSTWGRDFRSRIKRLGIKRKNLTPYSLRHSFITRMLEEDVNIHKIAKLAGHRIEQTATYEHLTIKDIQEAVKCHPLIRRASNPKDILQALKRVIEGFKLAQDARFAYEVLETENSLELKVRIK